MRNLQPILENKNLDFFKLQEYGFTNNKGNYIYEQKICDNSFKVIVEFAKEKQTSKIIDLTINEEYFLADIKDSSGDFVGKIKTEYNKILDDIIDKCTTPNVFKSKQAKEVIKYIKAKYGDELEYLWKKFPNNAIWRNKNNNKWYGILLVIKENKLGIQSNRTVTIIDLKYQKYNIKEIIDNKKVFKGYHMNKNNWITIKLDDSVDINEIYKFIDNSYILSDKK